MFDVTGQSAQCLRRANQLRHEALQRSQEEVARKARFAHGGFPEREDIDGSRFKDASGKVIWPPFVKAVQSSEDAG